MNAKKQEAATKNKRKNLGKEKTKQKYTKANNDINAQNKDMIEMPQKKEMPNMQQMPKSKRYDITLLAGWRESGPSGLIQGASHLRTKDHFETACLQNYEKLCCYLTLLLNYYSTQGKTKKIVFIRNIS